jgi:hypothetical protein
MGGEARESRGARAEIGVERPMRRLDSRAKASLHSSLPPLKSRAETNCGLAICPLYPLDKNYYLNQKIPTGILLGCSSSSKGITEFNGHKAIARFSSGYIARFASPSKRIKASYGRPYGHRKGKR